MKSILNEIGGLVSNPNRIVTHNPTSLSPFTGEFEKVLSLCSKMRPWQQAIFEKLKTKDLYIAAAPGAGKTLPYMCFWANQILQLEVFGDKPQQYRQYMDSIRNLILTPEKIGKLVVLVPIRSLAEQTIQEFKVTFSQMIATILTNYMSGILTDLFLQAFPARYFTPNQAKQIMSGSMEALFNAVHPGIIQSLDERRTTIDALNIAKNRGDFDSAKALELTVKRIDGKIEMFMMEGIKNIVEGKNNKGGLVAMRTGLETVGNPENATVVIAIYESAPKIISKIKGKIKMLVLDESHLIQDISRGSRDDIRSFNIAESLYKVLTQLRGVDYRLLFLSGTANPTSAKNFAKYLDACYGKNIEVIETPGEGNVSNISIHADNSIKDSKNLVRILKSGQHGTVIVIFSKAQIMNLAKQAIKDINPKSLLQVQKGEYEKYKFRSTLGGVSKYTGDASKNLKLDPLKIGQKVAEADLLTINIHDPLLRQAVQAGFGYIFRLDEDVEDFDKRKKDNQIVADLFSKGKIRTLLSTDAIGVGVNIKVKTLIIPTTEKPTGAGRREQMDPATLAQLLHRAGRGQFMFANIVTTDEDISRITHALSLDPTGFSKGAVIQGKIPFFMCRSVNTFFSLWRS
jgi:hypothetical protein